MGKLEKIEHLDLIIDELEAEISQVKKASVYLGEIENQQSLIKAQLRKIEETSKTLSVLQGDFEKEVNNLENHVQNNEEHIKTLTNKLNNSFSETIKAIEDKYIAMIDKVDILDAENKEIQSLLSETNENIANLHTKLSNQEVNMKKFIEEKSIQQTNLMKKFYITLIIASIVIIGSIFASTVI